LHIFVEIFTQIRTRKKKTGQEYFLVEKGKI